MRFRIPLVFSLILSSVLPANAEQIKLRNFRKVNQPTISRLLCLDREPFVRVALGLLSLKEYCPQPILYLNESSDSPLLETLDDVIIQTKRSPNIKAADFSYMASKDLRSSYFLEAFAPSFSLDSGSWSYNYTGSSTLTYPTPAAGQPSQTQEYDTSSSQIYSRGIKPTFSIPIFNPTAINLARYYNNVSFSTAYSSTASDISQYNSSLLDAINVWIAYQDILVQLQNVYSASESLKVTVAQYQIGLLAVPDVAQSLAQLRLYQNNLSSAIISFNNYYTSLSSNIGISSDELTISAKFFMSKTISDLIGFSSLGREEIVRSSLIYSDTIYSSYYSYLGYLRQSDYYLSSYLPSFGLSFGWSPSTSYSYKTVGEAPYSGTLPIDSYSQSDNSGWGNSIAITMSWKLFDSGADALSARSQRRTASSTKESAKQSALDTIQSSNQYYSNYINYSNELIASDQSIKSSQKAFYDTLVALKAGFSDITTLVQRLNDYSSSMTGYTSNLSSLLSSVVNIQSSTRSGYFEGMNPYNLSYSSSILDFVDLRHLEGR